METLSQCGERLQVYFKKYKPLKRTDGLTRINLTPNVENFHL